MVKRAACTGVPGAVSLHWSAGGCQLATVVQPEGHSGQPWTDRVQGLGGPGRREDGTGSSGHPCSDWAPTLRALHPPARSGAHCALRPPMGP